MTPFRLATLVAACVIGLGAMAHAQLRPSEPSGPAAPGPGSGPGTGPGSGGPQADPYFRYRVCNKSNHDAFVAVSNRLKPGSDVWRSHGWYAVARGQCIDVGTFPKGIFYWYGRDREGGQWSGRGDQGGENGCVDLNNAFDFTFSDAAGACPAGFSDAVFKRLEIDTSLWTSTLND